MTHFNCAQNLKNVSIFGAEFLTAFFSTILDTKFFGAKLIFINFADILKRLLTRKLFLTKNWRKLTKIFKFWAQLKCVNLCRITVIVNRTNKRKPSQQSYSRTIKQFVNSHSENGNTILLPQQWRMSRQEKLLFNPWRR